MELRADFWNAVLLKVDGAYKPINFFSPHIKGEVDQSDLSLQIENF